ncbi:hypothetical protein [Piscirickettsia salmonis]|nr:hypothetical protein [Piscirickettsia salmonis]
MLGDFASLDVQNTYRGSDAYVILLIFKCKNQEFNLFVRSC